MRLHVAPITTKDVTTLDFVSTHVFALGQSDQMSPSPLPHLHVAVEETEAHTGYRT